MPRQHHHAVPFRQRIRQAFQMLNIDIGAKIILIEPRHVEDLENIRRHIDEGSLHQLLRFLFRNRQPRHHLSNGPLPLFFYESVIQDTGSPPQCQ